MPYFKVTSKKILEQVNQHFDAERKARKKANKWARQFGATSLLTGDIAMRSGDIGGIVAPECPGPAWCRYSSRHHSDYWRPRLSHKEGKELKKQMDELTLPHLSDLFPILGYEPHFLEGIGYIHHPKGHWFVFETLERVKYDPPKGVRRISDITYESKKRS